jgi:hypothetical protein
MRHFFEPGPPPPSCPADGQFARAMRNGIIVVVLSNSSIFVRTAMIGEKIAEVAVSLAK